MNNIVCLTAFKILCLVTKLIIEKNKCLIGLFQNEKCSEEKLIDCKDFSDADRISLNARSGTVVNSICSGHNKQFHVNYIYNQKLCANPYKVHAIKILKSLTVISFEFYNWSKSIVSSIVPGNKLCILCMKNIHDKLKKHQGIEFQAEQSMSTVENDPVKNISRNPDNNTSDQEEVRLMVQETMSSNLSQKLQLSNISSSSSENGLSNSENSTPKEVYRDRFNAISNSFSLSPIKRKDLDRPETYAQLKYCEIKSKLHS